MKHVSILDSLRAIAALSVCLYHFICTTIGLFSTSTVTTFFTYGKYGVHVFFVISGFIIPYAMYSSNYNLKALPKFILKRLTRLEPPYIFSIILILGIITLKSKFNIGIEDREPVTAQRIALHFGYLINFSKEYKWFNNIYWTLAIEFQYYIIISFMYVLFVNKKIAIRFLAYILCFLMAYLFFINNTKGHFPYYAPLFLIGIITFLFKIEKISIIEFIIIFILVFCYNFLYLEPFVAILGNITSLIILFYSDKKIIVLNFLGKMSYSIYLIHPIIGAAVINLLSRHVNTNLQKIGIVSLGLLVTLISSYIMYLIIEVPSKKLSSKIKL